MKVSVIIPNYNHERFLQERIDSVLNQTYQDFEVIILDDCSTDNSRDIIETYRNNDKVSHIVFNDINSGSTFVQWQKGLELALGKWIWIAESDDRADVTFLDELLKQRDIHPSSSLIFCATNEVDAKGNFLKINTWSQTLDGVDWDKNFSLPGKEAIVDLFYSKNIIPNASAAIFKKDAVNFEIFNVIKQMKFAGDWLFWMKILEHGDLTYLSKNMNDFRCHPHTTREVKELAVERKRFAECLAIVRHVKSTYALSWNIEYHRWMLDEWKWKFINQSYVLNELFIKSDFPLVYKFEIYYRILIEKIRRI